MDKLSYILWDFVVQRVPKEFQNEARDIIDILPSAFYPAPASLTGKYHAPDERSWGGIALHSWRFAQLLPDYLRIINDSVYDPSLGIAAVVHDAFKPTTTRETYWKHPLLAANHMSAFSSYWETASMCCALHEGRWTDPRIFEELPSLSDWKENPFVKAFHQLDFFLSRYQSWFIMQDAAATFLKTAKATIIPAITTSSPTP